MSFAAMMLVALALESALGWPQRLMAAIGHPVTWIGALIATLDRRWNHAADRAVTRRRLGLLAALLVIAVAAGGGALVQALLPTGWPGVVLGGVLAWPLVAARSLHDHVAAVARPLDGGDLAGARQAVAQIVGRDPVRLDAAGVARAAIESLAENSADGVVAPLFWGLVFGLPGIAAYKAVNTLDSMIGHLSPRHHDFGRAAARIDDAANLIPARLTGGLIALVARRPRRVWAVMRRDARAHRSPNAGWPEAAMAGALGLRLSGPRSYDGRISDEPWLNPEGRDPGAIDIGRALGLYRRMAALLALLLLGAGMLATRI